MTNLTAALARLVDRDVLTSEQAAAVVAEASTGASAPAGLRRRFAEIAGYVGGAFVVGATVLFLGQEWDVLGRPGRVTTLAMMALVLFGVGLGVRLTGSEGGGADTRRRLASTLMTGAAGVAGFATQVLLSPSRPDSTDGFNRSLLAGGAVALAVVVAGYLLARSSVGQLGAAAAAVWTLLAALVVADVQSSRPFGLGLVALGVAWSGLAWSGRGRGGLRGGVGWGGRVRDGLGRARLAWGGPVGEPRVGLGISVTLALTGAQVAMFGPDQVHYLGHALTALVATGCFAAYVRLRDWLVLAGGVVGATLAVPEFLYDVTDGSLGAAGVLLAAGVTLLVASLAGLHLRRDRLTQPTGPDLSTR